MKKFLSFTFVMILAFVLVACGGGSKVTSVEVSASSTSVKVGESVKLTAVVKPEGVDQSVTWQSSKTTVATVDANGTVKAIKKGKVVITATSTADPNISGKVTISVTDTSSDKPDLAGYEIVITFSPGVEYELDPRLEYLGASGGGSDRQYAAQAWNYVEEAYNCTLTVRGFPVEQDSARWPWILEQAKNNTTDFDIYWVPTKQLSTLYTALIPLDDIYGTYGNNSMSTSDTLARRYKNQLYGWCYTSNAITPDDPVMGFNVKLLQQIDMEEPGKLFLEDKWDYNAFKQWCIDAQTKLNALSMDEEDKYYVISGPLSYYVRDFARTSGVALADTLTKEVRVNDPVVVAAANLLKELYDLGCVDPANQVDGNVQTWNNGHALLCCGSSYWVDYANRWNSTLWGDDTQYGFAPYPYANGLHKENARWATYTQDAYVFPKAITEKFAKQGNGNDNLTVENIFQAWYDCFYYTEVFKSQDPDFDKDAAARTEAQKKWDTEYSVQAWLYFGDRISEIGIFDPIKEITSTWEGDWGKATAGYISPNLGYTEATDYISAITPYLADLQQAFVEKYN